MAINPLAGNLPNVQAPAQADKAQLPQMQPMGPASSSHINSFQENYHRDIYETHSRVVTHKTLHESAPSRDLQKSASEMAAMTLTSANAAFTAARKMVARLVGRSETEESRDDEREEGSDSEERQDEQEEASESPERSS